MKTIFSSILFLLLVSASFAQSDKYAPAMQKAVAKLSASGNADSLQDVATLFQRIAQAELNQWIPYYYATYVTIIQSMSINDSKKRDLVLDQAQDMLDKTYKLDADFSECAVLQGFLYISRLQADPMNRGQQYSQMAGEQFQKAIELNPENPRGYYMKGVTKLHTPDFYGGGKVPAKPILTKAMEKFEAFKPLSPFSPNWGKDDCGKQLAACDK